MQKKLVEVLAVAAFTVALSTSAFAASVAGSNTVNSAAIIDGSVATADIASKAVTAAKIADSAVTATQIAAGAVTGVKVATGAITTAHIVNGAVTDAKISGTISAAKIAPLDQTQVIGLTAALADKASATHDHNALYQKKYGKVAVVAESGGDYTDPVAAMNDNATWCGGATPCLLKIMPGVYNLGANSLPMISGVDIEGSGPNMTKIVGTVSYYSVYNTEIRMLSIESGTLGIDMQYSGANSLQNVKITANGTDTHGLSYLYTQGNLTVNDSVINATGTGIYGLGGWGTRGNLYVTNSKITGGFTAVQPNYFVNTFITSSELSASYAIIASVIDDSLVIKDSVLRGSLNSGNFRLINTQFIGGFAVGSLKCLNVYDADFNPVTCQ